MFPIRDNIPSRTTPYVTFTIIGVNAVIFLFEVSLGKHLGAFVARFGMVPAFVANGYPTPLSAWRGVFTSMFLHADWMHVIGNMWMLWIFGDNVEDRVGHGRFAGFYLLWGLAANMLHLATNWGSQVPTIGASGAIAGVMGAYMLFYPRARVTTLIFIFYFIHFVEIPAMFFLGFWFFIQLLSGVGGLLAGAGRVGGVAWWAHIGGFAAGAGVAKLMKSTAYRGYPSPSDYRDIWR